MRDSDQMHECVGIGHAGHEARCVERIPCQPGTALGEFVFRSGPTESANGVSARNQLPGERRSEVSCGSADEYTHHKTLRKPGLSG